MKSKHKKILILVIFIGISLIAINYHFSLAKYISNSLWNYYLKSKEFYFSSNELDEIGKKNIDNMWDGENIKIHLNNSKNDSLITNYDISYKIECSIKESNTPAKCILNENNNSQEGVLSYSETCVNKKDTTDVSSYNKTNCEINGYDWVEKKTSQELSMTLTSEEELENATVLVTATAISPYKKVLTGEFILKKDKNLLGNINMQYQNYSDYGELIISNTHQQEKCINISWDSKELRLDYEESNILSSSTDTDGYINSIDLTISEKSNKIYRFYPLDNNKYDISSFKLIKKDNC